MYPHFSGRSLWKLLKLYDERETRTCKEIFEIICKSLRTSYNDGKIQPSAVIFEQKRWDKRETTGIRIWNSTLLSFAGHKLDNGDIVGDPSNAFLTELAKKMGWRPEGGMFDLLPVIITDADQISEMFELPDDIQGYVVDIFHPTIAAITNLGLKWYAIPSVTGMMLEAGGIQYTCAPISGFFQDTEVSVMDLLASRRYNLLEPVGRAMELDVSHNMSYWKTSVSTELTKAVYCSYREAGVTLVDHITMSEDFHNHMAEEIKTRGGCPADWLWIVPAMSSGITPVFHQEMARYTLSPSYEYQSSPEMFFKKQNKKRKSFYGVSWTVLLFVSMISKYRKNRKTIAFIYATESGTAFNFTKVAKELFQKAFLTVTVGMNEIEKNPDSFIKNLVSYDAIFFITSTYGEGDAPNMGKRFKKELLKPGSDLNAALKGATFAVFGLGSTQYTDFAGFGKLVFELMSNNEGESLIDLGLGDVMHNQKQAFDSWIEKAYKRCCKIYLPKMNLTKGFSPAQSEQSGDKFRWRYTNPTTLNSAFQKVKNFDCKVLDFKLVEKVNLSASKGTERHLLLKLAYESSDTMYNPGGHIALLPHNTKADIALAAKALIAPPFNDMALQLQSKLTAHTSWKTMSATKEFSGLTYEQYLTHVVDLTRMPGGLELKTCGRESEGVRSGHSAAFLGRLNKIDKRVYSIASADQNDGLVSILVSLHTFKQDGVTKMGFLSKFIKEMAIGESILGGFLAPAECMHLQQDRTLPMILISAGSGFAPFLSFIEQRAGEAMSGHVVGKIVILHGCWDKDGSFTEVLLKEARTYLDIDIFTAYSREIGMKKEYVQDVMSIHSNLLKGMIEKRSASVYVCGSGGVVGGVRGQLDVILDGEMSLESLITSHKYQEERFN